MLPVFDDNRRRRINLGGNSSATTHAAILDQAKARRSEREQNRKRNESAVRLQAWWRGLREVRGVRHELRTSFESDITGITGMRCLVLLGTDDEALGIWSRAMVSSGHEVLFYMAKGSDRSSWIVLVRQVSLLLLRSVAKSPRSPFVSAHLLVVNALCSNAEVSRQLGPDGTAVALDITGYLLRHDMYGYLATSLLGIPTDAKNDPALPHIISLIVAPFDHLLPAFSPVYTQAFASLFFSILPIPLLPNRIPLPSVTKLSSGLPLASFDVLLPIIPSLASLHTDSAIHVLANLLAFTPPRYRKLRPDALDAYLALLTTLLNSLPTNALDSEGNSPPAWTVWPSNDSDSEDDEPLLSRAEKFTPQVPPPALDSRTIKWISILPTQSHLTSLFHHPNRARLAAFMLALTTVWPAKKEAVLTTSVAYNSSGLVRELYRLHVRSSVLGRDDAVGALMDPTNAAALPPLLFLADLYTQALHTMGDDEFFANSSTTTSTSAPRNPLTLDELIGFSRQLLNIAFALYWREDQAGVLNENVQSDVIRMKWERVRDTVTRCLVAIHARDSRKPFTPPGHWLVSSQLDMTSFVEAAVYEEQQLQPMSSNSRPLSKRQMSYISPRLGVLNNIPFAIPFETRVSIFRNFVANDMVSRLGGVDRYSRMGRRHGTRVTVRRGMVAQDGFDKLSDADLKGTIEITFVDQFGQEEAGIDGGGVFKEFFTSLCKEVFDTDRGLWLATKNNELYPNPHAYATESHSLDWYRFIGRILGKALYEGILIDVAFAGFFLAKWLGRQSFLDDLTSLDPELYQGLVFLKHYEGNPEDLSLNFTVAIDEFGVAKTLDLIANGSDIPVTRANRLQYIHLVSHYRLSKQIKPQSDAFFEGLSEMIDPKWLRMFNQQELQILLGGVNSPIDLEDLRKHTSYGGLYDENERTIQIFWKVVESFDQDQRRALLRFVTSCSRPPLLGFKELVPNFAIRDAGSDEHRLPTSSTCINLLKLPRYSSEYVLRTKLLQAINSNAGFDLS